MALPTDARLVLLDIEGTTTPISFVYDTLFPYARGRLDPACGNAGRDPRVVAAVATLREEYTEERERNEAGLPEFGDGSAYARYLMDRDRKSTGLKALQGVIWEEGYRSGELRSRVFPDVAEALAAWREADVRMRVYSSGSVLAQKLLFAHTDHGDLTPYFEAYHDTTTGPKKEADSYRRIAHEADLPSKRILFLSDSVAELDAARQAGTLTGMMLRPGNTPADACGHEVHEDFLDLLPG